MPDKVERIVVGFSGGITSAWCAGWALRNFPKENVVFLFHDTKEEDADTYRFLRQMAEKLDHPITERSDGRSFTELCYDENMLPTNRTAFCSRILKTVPWNNYVKELRDSGVTDITRVVGFTANEPDRVQRSFAHGMQSGYTVRFPLIEEKVTKQQCYEWCNCEMGVPVPSMYEWSNHANCVGCARGGKNYWLAVKKNRPEVFEQRKALEKEFGHNFIKEYVSLEDLERDGVRRVRPQKESIELGPCECGD